MTFQSAIESLAQYLTSKHVWYVAPVVLIINYELEKRLCICNEDMLVNEAYRDAHNMVKALVDSKQATRNKQAKR